MGKLAEAARGRPSRRTVYVLGVEPRELADPGDGGALAATTTCFVALVSAHASPGETRTLGDPLFVGQELDLIFETDGGDCVVTADSAVNQTGNNTLTFADAGDHLRLIGARDGAGAYEWRVVANDGVGLTTV